MSSSWYFWYLVCYETIGFYAQQQLLLKHVLAIAILSVCLSVCHTGGSVKNAASYDHQIFTVGCLEDKFQEQ